MNYPNITGQFLGPDGTPASLNVILPVAGTPGVYAPYAPGQAGDSFVFGNKRWRVVTVDAGATACVVGTLLFWKNRATGVVTNVVADMEMGAVTHAWRNAVAGICQVAFTPSTVAGNQICILTAGSGVTIKCTSGTVGFPLIADVAASVGIAIGLTAVGTAPTFQLLGYITTDTSAGLAVASINIAQIPS